MIEPYHAIDLDTKNGLRSRQQNPLGVVRRQRQAFYEFEEVPPATFAAFKAVAKGRFFNEHIRNRFRYRQVAAGNDASC
ncbi:KTSC domain-containing protein [Mesorhizobium sp.]|uniref:KTSC domain-containing protein n=1 Tax=Mesorhizobium sp. TaxID=1871066 RepID=UPI00338E48ED